MIVILWLLIGVFASYQRGYFGGGDDVNCAELGTVLLTIVAGPLNYIGANPKVDCELPQPSE